jgi:DNA phosphorothioation-associated putative methyltransferase
VHFALTLFPGAPKYVTLPRSIQRDVRTFFGKHAAAIELARSLLFSVGNPKTVLHSIERASATGLGGVQGATFKFQTTSLPLMPAALRVVVGCAEMIEPDLASYDFIDIDPENGRVQAIRCDDASRSIPLVLETVTVDLKALHRKRTRPKGVMLYLKARYMRLDDASRRVQQEIDTKLIRSGLVSESGEGPSDAELARALKSAR